MKTRLPGYAWGFCILLLAGLLAFPIRTGKIRLAIVALLAASWLGLVTFLWIKRWRRSAIAAGGLPALAFGWIASSAGAPIPPTQLRELYLTRLRHYEGVLYVYGGENSLGIDCSGLVRRALADALLISGARHGNARAFRDAFSVWWRDSSALDMGNGAGGATIPLAGANGRPLAPLGHFPSLRPGDLVITAGGSHVFAFLGADEWIEAEPGIGRTHIFSLTGQLAFMAEERVKVARWKWLQE